MARIAGVDLPRDKRVEIALTYIYGIGRSLAQRILEATGVNPDTRVKDLTPEEIVRLRQEIEGKYKVEGALRSDEHKKAHRHRMLQGHKAQAWTSCAGPAHEDQRQDEEGPPQADR